jgi:hypothetical protein
MPLPRRNLLEEELPPEELAGLVGEEAAPAGTDLLSTGDLGELAGEGADMGELDVMGEPDLAAQLEDPNIDPAMRAELQSRLALAARRRLAGLGGGEGVL